MIFKPPAHKNMIDPSGQIVNPIPEQFLYQYIERKQQETPKKLTFEEWWERQDFTSSASPRFYALIAWNAGQDNK